MFRKKTLVPVCLVCKELLPWFDQQYLAGVKCETEHCWILWRWTPSDQKLTAVDWPGKPKDKKCGCEGCRARGK